MHSITLGPRLFFQRVPEGEVVKNRMRPSEFICRSASLCHHSHIA
jgi:hypothetical protein